ncbi:hypothetical protein, partial [Klebsiella phage vB_KpnM_TU02]
LNLDKLFLKA